MTKQDADAIVYSGTIAAGNLVSSANALHFHSAILSMIFEGISARGVSYHDWEVENKIGDIRKNLAGIRQDVEQWEGILSKLEASMADITD